MAERPHVAVVGGGIAGLAAARALAAGGARVTLLEGSARLGGKLHTTAVDDVLIDAGAESFLFRAPGATELARDVGLESELVHPAVLGAGLLSRGRLRDLPARTMFGIPTDVRALASSGVLSGRGLLRVGIEPLLPGAPPTEDVAVGELVGRRLGREIVDRLVDPLLGGVYAGRADELSLRATLPQLQLSGRRSLLAAARAAMPPPSGAPVFATVRGGLGRLVDAVVAATDADVVLGRPVRALRRTEGGWQLVHGPTRDEQVVDADRVLLALPAAPAARLLAEAVPSAAVDVGGIDYASVGLVTLLFREQALPPYTGYLVPEVEGRAVKAATFFTAKWPHVAAAAPGLLAVRCSFGRYGDTAALQRDDADLVLEARRELAVTVGLRAHPLASRVTRWGGALPQYAVGHVERVARIRAAVAAAGGLAVCGAAYDGVGIPACIRSGQRAAADVLVGKGPRA